MPEEKSHFFLWIIILIKMFQMQVYTALFNLLLSIMLIWKTLQKTLKTHVHIYYIFKHLFLNQCLIMYSHLAWNWLWREGLASDSQRLAFLCLLPTEIRGACYATGPGFKSSFYILCFQLFYFSVFCVLWNSINFIVFFSP